MRKLFYFDINKLRVDIRPTVASLAVVIGFGFWVLVAPQGTWLTRVVAAVSLAALMMLVLKQMGISWLSTALLSLLVLGMYYQYTPLQFGELCTFGVVAYSTLQYFILRYKYVAAATGLLVGLAAAMEPARGTLILILFVTILWIRFFWHGIFERLSRKQEILFGLKALAATIIAVGVRDVLAPHVHSLPWAKVGTPWLSLPHTPWVILVVGAVIAARGLWFVLLLRTSRSPQRRGLRAFLCFFSILLSATVGALHHYASQIFLPSTVAQLDRFGLLHASPETMIFVYIAALVLVAGSIDRFLYQDTFIARSVMRGLGEQKIALIL